MGSGLAEAAAGWEIPSAPVLADCAYGDDTAKRAGRLTLNPIPHIDPFGSIILPAMAVLANLPVLGWAKPVPVNPRNFRNYKRGDILVSLAGVAVNFILAFAFAILWALMEWGMRLAPDLVQTALEGSQPLLN